MGTSTTTAANSERLLSLPDHPVGYVAILTALIAGVVKLLLSQVVPDQTLSILFLLNGLGFLGGIALYLTRYWRRELYLVAALYAVVTIFALFVFEGFTVEAFYRQGDLNPMAVLTKVAEAALALCAIYLYE